MRELYSSIASEDLVDLLAVEHGIDLFIGPAEDLLVKVPEIDDEEHRDDGEEDLQEFQQKFQGCLLLSALFPGEALLARVLGGAQGAHELGVGFQLDHLELEHVLDGLLQAVVLGAAAGEGDAVGGAGFLGHDEAALGDGHLDAGGDLVHGLALADEGDDLALGEDGALGGDGDDVLRGEGELAKLGQGQLEGAGHGLEEAPGARGALVVHGEVLHGAVGVDADALDVLAADVDDGLDGGVGDVHAHGVAGDLADVLVREGDLVAAVAGADEVGEVLGGFQPGDLGDDLVHGRDGGLFGIDLAFDGGVGNHLAVLVEDDRFGVGGTYVATAEIFHTVYLLQFQLFTTYHPTKAQHSDARVACDDPSLLCGFGWKRTSSGGNELSCRYREANDPELARTSDVTYIPRPRTRRGRGRRARPA